MFWRKISAWASVLGIIMPLFLLPFLPNEAKAAGASLERPRDILNNIAPGGVYVQHEISFILPVGSTQVRPSDGIYIDLHNYANIIPPSSFTGLYGVPTTKVENNIVKLSNVILLPGVKVEIFGLVADNPGFQAGFPITISIGEIRTDGSMNVRNQATIVPSDGGLYITVDTYILTPQTAIDISGYTSPEAFVSLAEGGTIVGTTTADLSGGFNLSLTGIDPGNKSYSIFSSDNDNRSSSQTSVNVFVPQGMLTIVRGILLSPSIALDKLTISPGDTLTITGSAKPNCQLNIFVESPLRSYNTTTDNSGLYSYTLPDTETRNFTPGQYRTYAIVQDEYSNQSIVSPTITFTVANASDDNPEPLCDISHGDLNCDGKTNLTDFSILLYHWETDHKKADINKNGTVNLVDFSIMMYYFRF